MAYKKYIQRNGKLYGPYIYHSKRVDGKVVSEYYGNKVNQHNYKRFLFLFAGVFLAAVLIYFIAFSNHKITGGVVLGVDTSYANGKPLAGVLKFSLKEGELIPESSKIVFENSGQTQEFALNDILNEVPLEGNYYVPGKNISGEGLGYGIEGERTVYPEVGFTLQVYTNANGTTPNNVAPADAVPNGSIENTTTEPAPVAEPAVSTPTEDTSTVPVTTPAVTEPPNPTSEPAIGSSVSPGGILSFLGLTGRVVSTELKNEINGVVSKDKPFTYELKEGETVELKLKSVKIGDKELDDSAVSLKIEDGQAIVTTDYSETQKGYGQDYVGNKEKTISLDLSNLNLSFEQGDLTIKLVYSGEEILQLSTLLKEGEKTSNETTININQTEKNPPEVNVSNESIIGINQTINESVNFSFKDIGDSLTPEERSILANKFGNISLETTKSELFKGRIIIDYKFNEYSIEYSYDSSLTKEVLDVQMEKDRIKFLKDIAGSILKSETLPTNYNLSNESYNY